MSHQISTLGATNTKISDNFYLSISLIFEVNVVNIEVYVVNIEVYVVNI